MNTEDRLIEDADFYVKVQKAKIVLCVIGLVLCYVTGAFDDLIAVFV